MSSTPTAAEPLQQVLGLLLQMQEREMRLNERLADQANKIEWLVRNLEDLLAVLDLSGDGVPANLDLGAETPALISRGLKDGSRFQQLVGKVSAKKLARLKEAVCKHVPAGSRVLVVSRGDDELLGLDGRMASHFPQNAEGEYAGWYPSDSAEAIAHLEELRARGDTHLVFPDTAYWWFGFYNDLGRYLDREHERLFGDSSCIIYRLQNPTTPGPGVDAAPVGVGTELEPANPA